jgi:hypothetical protein
MNSDKILGPRIPSGDIIPEIREMAVSWNGHYSDGAIWNTMKLASDVQYVCINLLKQFAEEHGIPELEVELFFKDKKEVDGQKKSS